MKTAEKNTGTTAILQTKAERQPFFGKEGQDPFFSKSGRATDSFFNPTTIQPKLMVGQPNDKYEVEADAMADRVVQKLSQLTNNPPLEGGQGEVHGSSHIQTKCTECEEEEKLQKKEDVLADGISHIQRKPIFESNAEQPEQEVQTKPAIQTKCDKCKEEEQEQLQAKTDDPSLKAPSTVESKLNANKGRGNPLSPDIQNSMSSAFGTDFSSVRVHTGANAVQMNKELGAQAFTHGSDIYFNEGKYDTNSTSGKHLLAHELTHTVQQGKSGIIRKAIDPKFRVGGKFPGASRDNDSVYFDYSSSVIDSEEETKVDTLASSSSQDYDLIGFSSEEGGDNGNQRLTNRRLAAVDRSLAAKGHIGIRNKQNRFERGENKLHYRRLRRVDILNAGSVSEEPDCSVSPVVSCETSFDRAFPVAIAQTVSAFIKMLTAPFDPVEHLRVQNAVAGLFGDVSHYDTVRDNLLKLLIQISDQPNTVSCHNSCDNTCAPSIYGYMDGNTGPGAVLTLCSLFYNETDPNINAGRLIHEALHATPGVETEDLAYFFERGIFQLAPADALKNTDSYVLLIKELNNPGSVFGSGGTTRDIIDPGITGTELQDLRRVMAYLEKWLIESRSELSSLYNIIVEVRGAGTWTGVSFEYYKETMTFVAPLFGLTVPNGVPRETDQVAIAGIYDRILQMVRFLAGQDIIINKDPGAVRFGAGPSEPLLVNDLFLSSGQNAMVYTLIEKIVMANSNISISHKPKYISLIELIRDHSSQPAP